MTDNFWGNFNFQMKKMKFFKKMGNFSRKVISQTSSNVNFFGAVAKKGIKKH